MDLKKKDKILDNKKKSGQKRTDANDFENFNFSNKRGGENCKQIISGGGKQLYQRDKKEVDNNEQNYDIDQVLQMGK